jgi:hypothetical protein
MLLGYLPEKKGEVALDELAIYPDLDFLLDYLLPLHHPFPDSAKPF